MKPSTLYRIASIVFLLFAAGHTMGFLTFRPASTEGLAVFNAMESVTFAFNGAVRSYGEFYKGFGLQVSAYLLFSAVLAWLLARLASTHPKAIVGMAWALAAVQLSVLVLCVVYFFLLPTLLSAVILICLLWAAWRLGSAAA
jgi:hypothetical protein